MLTYLPNLSLYSIFAIFCGSVVLIFHFMFKVLVEEEVVVSKVVLNEVMVKASLIKVKCFIVYSEACATRLTD